MQKEKIVLMRRSHGVVLSVTALTAVIFGGLKTGAAQTEPSVDGKHVYETYCVSCHGKAGKGDGPAAMSEKRLVPDLTSLSGPDGKFDEARMQRAIRDHVMSEKMRSWGETFMNVYSARGLADQALRNVTSHVRTLQTPHP